MAPEVKCTVDSCHYWKDNICTAETIEVAKNFMDESNMETGIIGEKSNVSAQTMCNTFKPKEK